MIKYSAPAKIHLLGEHSVVYGKPAILSAINLRAIVQISKQDNQTQYPADVDKLSNRENYQHLKKIIDSVVRKKYTIKSIPPYSVRIDSQIPIGAGLGSSAAVSTAYIASLLSFLKVKWGLSLINELAFEAEKIFHGNPSGGDNTTVVYGGLIWYRKELDFLKTFAPLPFRIHKNIKPFFLIDSGKPVETTREMVGKVRSKIKYQSFGRLRIDPERPVLSEVEGSRMGQKSKIEKIFNHQEELVKELAIALKDGDEEKLIQIIRAGERNLENLGVVGKKAKAIIRRVERQGGAAKILGGGGFKEGSGMILCYHRDSKGQPRSRSNRDRLDRGKKITIGEEGLRQEDASVA